MQSANAGGQNGFVAKLNAAGSAFVYTTYLGGNRTDWVQGVAMDPAGNAYVTGYTDSNTFPVASAIQANMQGNSTSLFHSSDTGAKWTASDTNIPGEVFDILLDPAIAGTIVVSTENGIYRTTTEDRRGPNNPPLLFRSRGAQPTPLSFTARTARAPGNRLTTE